MKALLVTSKIPYPAKNGGTKRIESIAKSLNEKNFEITLVALKLSFYKSKISTDKYGPYNKIYIISIPLSTICKNILKNFFTSIPFQVAIFSSKQINHFISKLSSHNTYDISIFHLIRTSTISPYVKSRIKILEMTDSYALNYQREVEQLKENISIKNLFLYIFFKLELDRLRKYEQKLLNLYDKISLVSNIDKSYVIKDSRIQTDNILIVPLYVQNLSHGKGSKHSFDDINSKNLIFLGQLNYKPNERALLYFLESIFPIIIKNLPNIRLNVIGANASWKIKKAVKKYPNVHLRGFVDDLNHEFKNSLCMIAPMISGSGMQTKILDSMSFGVPVVTTSLGLGGFEFKSGEEIFIADTPKDFANTILNLFNNKKLYISASNKCFDAINKYHSKNRFNELIEKLIF